MPEITELLPGCIVDRGITDASNMGAAMAPAAADTVRRYLDSGADASSCLFVTGDLGAEGSAILCDLLRADGIDIEARYTDCGLRIYERTPSDTHSGGSGCGCSATVLAAELLEKLRLGQLHDMVFIATGALMNALAVNQGQSIPGIAHLVRIRAAKRSDLIEGQGGAADADA